MKNEPSRRELLIGLAAAFLAFRTDIFAQKTPHKKSKKPATPQASIEDEIKKIIVEQLGVDEHKVTPNARFVEDLGIDSLDCVELIMAFEEKFDIEIADADAEKFVIVQNCVDYIKAHVKPNQNTKPSEKKNPSTQKPDAARKAASTQ